jgi:hypothetical protein
MLLYIEDTDMAKDRPETGSDGLPLPILPPDRDGRVWGKLVRVMFYTPGFMALLLLKTGEPTSFGITVELLMLSSAAAAVGGLFVGAQSVKDGADPSSQTGIWCGSLVLELLAVVPFLCAIPALFRELAHSSLLHAKLPAVAATAATAAAGSIDTSLGASELLPAVAILPFMLYQLAGFGTLHYVVSKVANWVINVAMLGLIVAATAANRQANYDSEKTLVAVLVVVMAATVFYGVLKLRQMQIDFDRRRPTKEAKEK